MRDTGRAEEHLRADLRKKRGGEGGEGEMLGGRREKMRQEAGTCCAELS